jgi:ATP-binding cassette subfamily B protein RaxB
LRAAPTPPTSCCNDNRSWPVPQSICFFAERPNQERIEACAKLAAVHDDIMVMPMGYNTLIGDMGTALSGGQKQRVLLARALYRRPGILFLDEATSHLDVEREKAVNDALRTLRLTRIVIAHRPETIRAADRVITLEAGAITERSTGRSAPPKCWRPRSLIV